MGINCAENREPVEIYGPVGLRKFIRVSLELSQSLLGFTYSVIELHCFNSGFVQGDTVEWTCSPSTSDSLHPNETSGRTIYESDDGLWKVCREGNLTVFAAPLKHRVTCFGYVIQEQQLPGN
ncbi:Zinc phosphodiesterase ELAC protein 1 [Desmophyllum pertusum]|uniref:Zinc phosphodiesterase ELAC protein 1 n=1 Tax=Desmophyllum pertusum TaxID=174260 RepID=A0A9X0CU80_9CNID|nr:Zinc phosphodiesterase ELAC protein 1 [Desmophyllum pertusum]